MVGWVDDDGCYHAPWECEETWHAVRKGEGGRGCGADDGQPSISDSLESSEPQVQEEVRKSKRRRKGRREEAREDKDEGERDDD